MAEDTMRALEQPLRFDGPATEGAAGADASGAMSCSKCGTAIGAYYYEAGGAVYCARCKRVAEESAGRGTGGLGRAAMFGLGAAVLGAFGYWAFIKITNHDWAVVSVAVAVIVAKAVHKGNGGRAGRRFQLLAVALTYFAIGGAYAPFLIKGIVDASKEQGPAAAAHVDSAATAALESAAAPDAAGAEPAAAVPATDDSTSPASTARAATAPDEKPVSPGKAILFLIGGILAIALAGPVLSVVSGGFPGALINVAIIGFALRRAWVMTGAGDVATGGHVFTGPYKVAERTPSPFAGAHG